ncbi:MAG: inositol monophosphatase family protein [Oceanococcaceae bacterium]
MHPLVNIGVSAARSAGNLILRSMEKLDQIRVERKGPRDFVTEIDRAAEAEIIRIIHKAYPGHAILGEESGAQGDNPVEWIIDPIDGTTNFLHGLPHFCVSIGVREHGKLTHGVIYDPYRQDLFTASRGDGALLNNRRIRVNSRPPRLAEALIGTGEPFTPGPRLNRYLPQLTALVGHCGGIRRAGSAALDLAYVASGRLDAFWELNLKPWDLAACIVLCQEAGAAVYGLKESNVMQSGDIAVAHPRLLEELRRVLEAPTEAAQAI